MKNSTFATDPSLSEALAAIVTEAPALKVALLAGLVMLTEGRLFGGGVEPPYSYAPISGADPSKVKPIFTPASINGLPAFGT
ncbi:hypothetical protein C900_02456 [Fulvivirga imtechensis AK7]|uniref:Uncharacterized protein n=1 Tax=Fulvivirga imtechensis AK7 TaxID=1237149 RepID=L8JTS6_9BACT|nr:hypothetical protein C900_02456 [Fulvivirga imtechensis AK7]